MSVYRAEFRETCCNSKPALFMTDSLMTMRTGRF